MDDVRPDDLDREIEAFYDAEPLRAARTASTQPSDVLPEREPATAPPSRGELEIWLWTGSLWLVVIVVTLLTVLFK